MRMFLAAVPPPDVLDGLEAFLEPRRQADHTLRWTDPYQWHLTLAFMAEVPERRQERLAERLRRSAGRRRPVRVVLGGAGAFPGADRARVLWLGATAEPADGLARLVEGARAAAVRAGVEVEGGRFRAHLTLARLGVPADVTRWLRVVEGFGPMAWTVHDVQLIASHLGEGRGNRPRYELVESFPLGIDADVEDGTTEA